MKDAPTQRLHPADAQALLHSCGDELRAIVRANEVRYAPDLKNLLQPGHHILRRDVPLDIDRQALPRVFVHDGQHLQLAPVLGLIHDEVIAPPGAAEQAPNMIGVLGALARAGVVARPQPPALARPGPAGQGAGKQALSSPPPSTLDEPACGPPSPQGQG